MGSTEMARPEWPKSEAQRGETAGFLGKGCYPFHQLGGLGSKLPQWGLERSTGDLERFIGLHAAPGVVSVLLTLNLFLILNFYQ